ncbi:transglycosylase SLT domain-containing protein [Vicingaceae bacterium]|nr:transglycosylase SLT domain-containing protein [Vicingaceae bacterium]
MAKSEVVILNNIALKVNPTDIVAREKRRVIDEEYIRENSVFAQNSKYAETTFSITLEFNLDDEIAKMIDKDYLPAYLKLLCQLDNYPFLFVTSEIIRNYLSESVGHKIKEMIFGVDEYTLVYSSEINNSLILVIKMRYFNHLPFAKDLSYYSIGDDPTQEEKSKVVNGKPNIRTLDETLYSITSSEVFDRYFNRDYSSMFNRMSKYKNGTSISKVAIRKPLYLTEEPESVEFETMKISEITEDNKPVEKDMFVTWPYIEGISTISDGASALIPYMSITKRNNFASHSLTGWVYPILQYMGKGSTDMSIKVSEKALTSAGDDATVIHKIKNILRSIDAQHLNLYRFSQFNLVKFDAVILDLLPMFGFMVDEEHVESHAQLQEMNNAVFNFKGKDIGGLIKKKGFNTANTRGVKIDFSTMISTIKDIYNGYKDKQGSMGLPFYDDKSDDSQPMTSFGRHQLRAAAASRATPVEKAHSSLIGKWPEGLSDVTLNKIEDQHGLPLGTLFNLMMAESSGDPEAIRLKNTSSITNSKSITRSQLQYGDEIESSGLFQFTPATARAEIISLNDPHNPLASAEAAAKLLKYNLDRYDGDTNLMLAAYNAGPTKVDRAIESANGSTNMKDLAPHLWASTSDYVNKIKQGVDKDNALGPKPEISYTTDEINKIIPRIELLAKNINETLRPGTNISSGNTGAMLDFAGEYHESNREIKPDGWYILERDVQELFLEFDTLSSTGNKLLSSHMSGFNNYLDANHDVLLNSFEGEAYSDLSLGDRLGLEGVKAEGVSGTWVEAKDVREINPMFFMNEEPHFVDTDLSKAFFNENVLLAQTAKDLSDDIARRIIEETGSGIGTIPPLETKFKDEDKILSKKIKILKKINKLSDEINPSLAAAPRGDYELKMDDIGPGNEKKQSKYYFPRSAQPFDRGINQAFPVIKVFIVEGDEGNIKENFIDVTHEYYELQGIISTTITSQTDDSPVDGALIVMANPGSVYTDNTVYMDMIKPKKNHALKDTAAGTKFIINKLALRPGHRVHIKAGYSNDINKLETMFNGIVTEIYGEHKLTLLCESFGRELISFEHGDDPVEDHFSAGADTAEIIDNMLYSPEIEHFGNYKFNLSSFGITPNRDSLGNNRRILTISNFYMYTGSQAVFMNIFVDNIIANEDYGVGLNPFGNRDLNSFFPLYRITPWQVLKEMEYRHPGSLARPCNYGDRHTFFFGIKEQLYVYRALHPSLSNGSINGEDKKNLRLKPVSDMHLISTDHNLISNDLRVTSDFNTVVDIQYWDEPADILNNKYQNYEMKIDDNLRPMAHRKGRCEMSGIQDKYSAFNYGSTYLRKEVERMYDGDIIITGNQNMKSGDYAILDDTSRQLHGIIKIRECTHHFDTMNGYVTRIKPGMYVESSHVDYSLLFSKLFIAYSQVLGDARRNRIIVGESNESYSISEHLLDILGEQNISGYDPLSEEGIAATADVLLVAGLSSAAALIGGKKIFNQKLVKAVEVAAKAVATAGLKIATVLNSKPLNYLFKVGRIASGPIGWVGALLVSYISNRIEETQLTRQPIRMYPLQLNGSTYIGGIWGYHEGGYFEDLSENIKRNISAADTILSSANLGAL